MSKFSKSGRRFYAHVGLYEMRTPVHAFRNRICSKNSVEYRHYGKPSFKLQVAKILTKFTGRIAEILLTEFGLCCYQSIKTRIDKKLSKADRPAR